MIPASEARKTSEANAPIIQELERICGEIMEEAKKGESYVVVNIDPDLASQAVDVMRRNEYVVDKYDGPYYGHNPYRISW